jgi:hypothetical protein
VARHLGLRLLVFDTGNVVIVFVFDDPYSGFIPVTPQKEVGKGSGWSGPEKDREALLKYVHGMRFYCIVHIRVVQKA